MWAFTLAMLIPGTPQDESSGEKLMAAFQDRVRDARTIRVEFTLKIAQGAREGTIGF